MTECGASTGYSKKFCNKCAQYGHSMYMCMAFKTRLCKFFMKGYCRKPSPQCVYAHGEQELRPSSPSWCTRITYVNGARTVEGCCNPGHSIDTCQQVDEEWCTQITYVDGARIVEGCCNPGHSTDTCPKGGEEWIPPPLEETA